ncbi:hypothetical protein ACEWY4_020197 [Coilia grayii]|uniref:MARVEL domain-containing protein n=1 Tax=Coilia grayii TaxID=363190 RepID=A0ABD1JBZ6_9TELE
MADQAPYQETTTPIPGKSKIFGRFDICGFIFKILQLVLSFLAFVLEEIVTTCNACAYLYFFEFVSCTAFLFTLLLIVLLATKLHSKVGITQWDLVDFAYTLGIGLLFLLASGLFLNPSNNNGSDVETASGILGIIASLVFLANAAYLIKTKRTDILTCLGAKGQQPQTQPQSAEREKLNGQP